MSVREVETEVCIIGSGLAGMMAALAAHSRGAKVLTLGKFSPGRGTCSISSNGRFNAPGEGYGVESMFTQTMQVGKGINDQVLAWKLVSEIGETLDEMARMTGVRFVAMGKGACKIGKAGGIVPGDGRDLTAALVTAFTGAGIEYLAGYTAVELIVEDNHCKGLLALSRLGEMLLVRSKAVVLAAGGCGGIFEVHNNPESICGDSYAMAARAGAALRDMEFIQFYSLAAAEKGQPRRLFFQPTPDSARLIDQEGRDVIATRLNAKITLSTAMITMRDELARAIVSSERSGSSVYLDFSETTPEELALNPHIRNIVYPEGKDKAPRWKVTPTTHFCMGGVSIDTQARTTVEGLIAVGEAAGGVHGANRMGGNALTECLVFGRTGGISAAEMASAQPLPNIGGSLLETAVKSVTFFGKPRTLASGEINQLRQQVKRTMWDHLGPVRDGSGMEQAGRDLASIEESIKNAAAADPRSLLKLHELRSMVATGQMITSSALWRKESRGSHYRTDYPRESAEFAKGSTVHQP
ncbi:MAG: FAD-binding protein [Firmicutes bacterium]|nr:FAD-binding protein [Bacillota bacterium]